MSKTKTKRLKKTDFKKVQFVMNNLDSQQLIEMDAQPFDTARYMEFLEKLIDLGFDVKMSWDTYTDKAYQVTVGCYYDGNQNTGFAVSGRSTELQDAVKIVWFKISYIADYDLTDFSQAPKSNLRG